MKNLLAAAAVLGVACYLAGEEVTLEFPPPGVECPRTLVTFTTPVDMGSLGANSLPDDLLGEEDPVVYLEASDTAITVDRQGFCSSLLSGDLYLQVVSLIGPVRPEAFSWRVGDGEFRAFPGLGEWVHITTLPPGQESWTGRFSFRYAARITDPAGAYGVRLKFNLDYPELPDALRELYRATWEVMVTWNVEEMVVLMVHGPVDLGVIGPGIYVPGQGFGALESLGNPVSVGTNIPQGVAVSVRAVSASVPHGFPGGEGALWGDLSLRANGGSYLPVAMDPLELGEVSGPGWHTFRVDYRYQVDEGDVPGQYGATLQYTVTSP